MPQLLRHDQALRLGALSAALFIALGAQAQPRTTALKAANAVLNREFSQVRGIHELRDGRVLISDRIDERVLVADFANNKLVQIGRVGPGPAEYRLPTNLIWMPADSILLVDEGNTRLAVIAPDLTIKRSFRIDLPGMPSSNSVRTIDARGRLYTLSPFWIPRPKALGDSLYLLRSDLRRRPADPVDTIGTVLGITLRPDVNKPRLTPGFPFVAMAPQDAWNVRRDGTIVLIRSNPYRMEWISADGVQGSGPDIPYTPVKVTTNEKFRFTRDFLANSPTSGRGDDGMSATPASAMTEKRIQEMMATNAYAEFKGPTTGRAPLFGVNNAAWVERSVPNGEPAQFDVFDTRGAVIERIQLPANRRLVAVGSTWLYLVSVDEDGVERVERYAIPPTLSRLFKL